MPDSTQEFGLVINEKAVSFSCCERRAKANTARAKMTTSAVQKQRRSGEPDEKRSSTRIVRRLAGIPVVRELLVIITFCLFTTMVTWPYVTRLRDVVVDKGDPYLMAWILWWDYHQTFTDPLHLFNANVFYPLKYSLAFSEHSYGLALLCFPLYALGLKPLTVQAIAVFMAFALTGYGAFRLGRTLTGSSAVGWVAGIIFAFIPFRFGSMSQVIYLFSPWMPLLFEALVLFVRERSRKRALWLGCAFLMSGLTTISWFTFSLIPFAVYGAVLLTRYRLWREGDFWRRGAVALATASLLLAPFMVPYVLASRLYGFKRTIEEIKANSAWPIHWLSVENRNKLWNRMGEGITDGWKFKLFPGLLPILFSLAALAPLGDATKLPAGNDAGVSQQRWIRRLDIVIVISLALSILAIGFDGTDAFGELFFRHLRSERTLALLTGSLIARLCLAYPSFLRRENPNLVDTIRSPKRGDAFWLGLLLTVIGFCYSLGWNFFFYRICYDLMPMFKSMRVVTRGAMVAYLGLALLAGLGVKHLAEILPRRFPWLRAGLIVPIACGLLLFELNAAPLRIERGEVFPDAVTVRLKQTPMRGGLVVLPVGGMFNYRYMLRAADHQKPLIVGTSGFNSPIESKIELLTNEGAIQMELMTFLESVPTSYLVIANNSILPERTADYEMFLANAVAAGRLRYVNRFDRRDDLYAVVKNEPEALSEAPLPFGSSHRDWAERIHDDPVSLLSQPLNWSQKLYRVYLASSGAMPRYRDFMPDLEKISRGILAGSEGSDYQFANNFREFLVEWTRRPAFLKRYGSLDNAQYVDRILENAGFKVDRAVREALVSELSGGPETRAIVLLKIVDDPSFTEKEQYRSLVLLHYFGYLRRNPGDPPDGDMRGFNFWLEDAERHHNPAKLSAAFRQTGEYHQFEKKQLR
jgi:hypothetical protein